MIDFENVKIEVAISEYGSTIDSIYNKVNNIEHY